jgi:hypothetical protein
MVRTTHLRPLAPRPLFGIDEHMDRRAEWVGGCVRLPNEDAFVWLDPDGSVLGTTPFDPAQIKTAVVDHFRATTQKPAVGAPHVPARVRVASDTIAASLREALAPDVEVVCAPTPEITVVAASMNATPVPADVATNAVGTAELYAAAARLFRAQPWNVLDEDAVFSVSVPSLGLEHGVVSVLGGREGERLGLLFFTSVDDFARYLEGALEVLESGEDRLPSKAGCHLVLDFSKGRDVPEDLRTRIAANGYEIAAPNGYPCFAALDERFAARVPDAREAKLLVLTAHAFAELATTSGDLGWLRTDGLRRRFGELELEYPHPELELDVDTADFGDDIDTLVLYEDFVGSPEARHVAEVANDEDDPTWPLVLLNFAEEHHDVSVADLTPLIVEDVVFRLLPLQPACNADDAPAIIADLRAFFTFLARTGACAQASSCLELFDGGSLAKLERAFTRVN